MKILIGGSMVFAKEQIKAKKLLESQGHEILLTDNIDKYLNSSDIKKSFEEELKVSLDDDIMMRFFKKLEDADAFLVINNDKKGIEGYLGMSVLMELGLAYYLKKKIFFLKNFDKNQDYGLEVSIINPVILNGDLSKVR